MTAPTFTQPAAGWANPALTGLAGEIAHHVIDVIKEADRNAPRSRQVAIGPSEVGTPCALRLAYKLHDWLGPTTKEPGQRPPNADTDPWTAIVGTAVHAWLETTFTANNPIMADGRQRYVIEQRVHADAEKELAGSSDLYDRAFAAVIDWKVPGTTRMREYRQKGPGEQYRTQAHVYGLGYARAGERVDHVAIMFLPRSGRLDGTHVWTEPFQPEIAWAALERRDNILKFIEHLEPEFTPQHWALFPRAESHCLYCPWHLPGSTDLSLGCPGPTG